jgi:ubiquinone/menaquinone biosynthesis C-methylase UbiE
VTIASFFSTNELRDVLRIIGLARTNGELYVSQIEKFDEVMAMAEHITAIMKKMTKRKTVTLLDCACGKGYLTFLSNYILTNKLERTAFFIGIDKNTRLISRCVQIQKFLGFKNMEFHAESIIEFEPDKKPDITYCLHACDNATDETITKGILSGSRFIMAVPCCQIEISRKIRNHPLKTMTQFPKIKEQLCSLITDSMRALILSAAGYKVDIFESIPSRVTPKNLMLRAEKIWPERIDALRQYWQLRNLFNVEPKIEEYLPWLRAG